MDNIFLLAVAISSLSAVAFAGGSRSMLQSLAPFPSYYELSTSPMVSPDTGFPIPALSPSLSPPFPNTDAFAPQDWSDSLFIDQPLETFPPPPPSPSPPPPPPKCGLKPTCRLFVEDLLCCTNTGVVTDRKALTLRLQCTHDVTYHPGCFTFSGPTNYTIFNTFNKVQTAADHIAQVSIHDNFTGVGTIEVEPSRLSGNESCSLNIPACEFDGEVFTSMQPVLGLNISSVSTLDFDKITENVEDMNLDNFVYPNILNPSTCQMISIENVTASFYENDWITFSDSEVKTCNYTAWAEAIQMPPTI